MNTGGCDLNRCDLIQCDNENEGMNPLPPMRQRKGGGSDLARCGIENEGMNPLATLGDPPG